VQRTSVVSVAVLWLAASRWVANYIEKTFYFQDYIHAHEWKSDEVFYVTQYDLYDRLKRDSYVIKRTYM
jgi:hypothetical protein